MITIKEEMNNNILSILASRSRFIVVSLSVLISMFLVVAFITSDVIYEDAYIYFRMVQFLIDGEGFIFNLNEEPTEYGSSIIWPLLLAFTVTVTALPMATASKVLGILLSIGSLVTTYKLSAKFIKNRVFRLAPVLLLSTYMPFVLWTQMGLETPLYVLLIAILAFFLIHEQLRKYWALIGVLIVFTRSEGIFLLCGVVGLGFVLAPSYRKLLFVGAIWLGVAFFILELFRVFYFHDFLPTPFYAKIGNADGLLGLHRHFLYHGTYLLLLASVPAFIRSDFWTDERRMLGILIVLLLAWFVYSADYGPFFRHAIPAMPILFVLITNAISAIEWKNSWLEHGSKVSLAIFAVSSLTVQPTGFTFSTHAPNVFFREIKPLIANPSSRIGHLLECWKNPAKHRPPENGLALNYEIGSTADAIIGRFIHENYSEGSLVVYDQMGQTPFFSGKTISFIDSWGLVNKQLSHVVFRESNRGSLIYESWLSLTEWVTGTMTDQQWLTSTEQAVDYIYNRRPDIIMLHEFILQNKKLDSRLPMQIFLDPRLEAEYRLRYRQFFTLVYERIDSVEYNQNPIKPEGIWLTENPSHAEIKKQLLDARQ